MTYQVVSRPAQRTLRKLDATVARRVEAAIEGLTREPYPRGVTPLRATRGCFACAWGTTGCCTKSPAANSSCTYFKWPTGESPTGGHRACLSQFSRCGRHTEPR